ncbi:hypothetical protein HYH03_017575 [Edaphochlamys debaryana]|uniref:CAAX prenyl protease 2/Lysostaphin resistance protein A-like domain-containing protein n=1 Tax=Edaphochlamys debaryana TaxID=47281 RepID=A0A836BQG2_9CHLO|nr:hypothetical protein HYH03_017575 [Edaphochlamys debaryana]|eukprot:KAG2483568.1 hypothetical protein HYH03_017575 [Edaphochlamys debaryana]
MQAWTVPTAPARSERPPLSSIAASSLGAPARCRPCNASKSLWPFPPTLAQRSGLTLRCRAARENVKEARKPVEQPAKLWGRSGGSGDGDDEESTWGVFDLKRYDGRWDVPWGAGRVAGGLALWFGSFVAVGFLVVPSLYRAAGVSLFDLSPEDKASFTLVCQLVETVVSLALVRVLTVGPLKEAPPPAEGEGAGMRDFFNYSPAGPFAKPRGWAFWALLGMLAAPLVVGASAAVLEAVGYERAMAGGQGTVDGVASMIDLDTPTYLSLLAVTGALAPILEETVFRGFLLTSLTRYLPTWAAVVTSSVAFGAAHLSSRDFPVLCALGCLLGVSYVRSRNLLTPIIIHGAWNSSVLSLLFWLANEGVNVQELLKEVRNAAAS